MEPQSGSFSGWDSGDYGTAEGQRDGSAAMSRGGAENCVVEHPMASVQAILVLVSFFPQFSAILRASA